ncbi:hypothetical protein [Pueribacillus sp. YX66]|uniref:hypothetical protein n=1 Tax=Pueribacillus sp. YX66 TaxID=3229242 RepID=UPI00358D585C
MEKDRYFYYDGENPPMEVSIPKLKGTNGTSRFMVDHVLMKGKSDRQYNAVMGKRYGVFRNPLLFEILNSKKCLEVI